MSCSKFPKRIILAWNETRSSLCKRSNEQTFRLLCRKTVKINSFILWTIRCIWRMFVFSINCVQLTSQKSTIVRDVWRHLCPENENKQNVSVAGNKIINQRFLTVCSGQRANWIQIQFARGVDRSYRNKNRCKREKRKNAIVTKTFFAVLLFGIFSGFPFNAHWNARKMATIWNIQIWWIMIDTFCTLFIPIDCCRSLSFLLFSTYSYGRTPNRMETKRNRIISWKIDEYKMEARNWKGKHKLC